jgi:hypothetical protein
VIPPPLRAGPHQEDPFAHDWDDFGAHAISAFLDHLEADRHNMARSCNARPAVVRSLFRFAALHHPEYARVLAIRQRLLGREAGFRHRARRGRCPPRNTPSRTVAQVSAKTHNSSTLTHRYLRTSDDSLLSPNSTTVIQAHITVGGSDRCTSMKYGSHEEI